jgi:hypothetical protein
VLFFPAKCARKAIASASVAICGSKMAEERWSHAMRRVSEEQVEIGKLKIENGEEKLPLMLRVNGALFYVNGYPRA